MNDNPADTDPASVGYVKGVFKAKPINDYVEIDELPTTNGEECTCDKDGYIILGVGNAWDNVSTIEIYVNERWIVTGGQTSSGADATVISCFSAYVKSGFKYKLSYSNSAYAYLLHD